MKIVAHRGASREYPEQTLSAFRAAFEQGAHAVECDIRLTRCGQPVCIHDPVIDRVSEGHGRVSAMSLAELKTLNFGTPEQPEHVCTLAELLDLREDYPDREIFIETKHPLRYGRLLEEELLRQLRYRRLEASPQIHLISFSTVSINRMRRLAPQLQRVYLQPEVEKWYHCCTVMSPRYDRVGMSMLHTRLLDASSPAPYYVWTVDDPDDARFAQDRGVEWLATNEPGLMVETLAAGEDTASH